MEEKVFPPRKDYVATYKKYLILTECAKADLNLLLAQKKSFTRGATSQETIVLNKIEIQKQRSYLERLKMVIRQFGKSLKAVGESYNDQDSILFTDLIIYDKDIEQVANERNLSVEFLENKKEKFLQDLKNLEME